MERPPSHPKKHQSSAKVQNNTYKLPDGRTLMYAISTLELLGIWALLLRLGANFLSTFRVVKSLIVLQTNEVSDRSVQSWSTAVLW